jgi:uncharacterized protein (TIGR02300 family)
VKFNSMTTISSNKAMRGTKRVCSACEVRFYDLMRGSIACPSCGAPYVVQPAVEFAMRKASPARSSWRQSTNRPIGVEPRADVDSRASAETVEAEDLEVASGEVASASPEDDTVLVEQDGDAPDVTDLVELDVRDPKEA